MAALATWCALAMATGPSAQASPLTALADPQAAHAWSGGQVVRAQATSSQDLDEIRETIRVMREEMRATREAVRESREASERAAEAAERAAAAAEEAAEAARRATRGAER